MNFPALPLAPPATRRSGRGARQAFTARLQLMMTAALVGSIIVAATAVTMGVARAQGVHPMTHPDTRLVLALMLGAIGVMGVLSALAVRLAGRSRHRS